MILFSVREACVLRSVYLGFPAVRREIFYKKNWRLMKTYKHLYNKVFEFENIYLAYRKARKGKRGRLQPAMFERVQEDEMLALQDELQNKTYKPGEYHS